MTPASGLYLLEKDVAWWPDLARFAASGDDDARRRLFRALVEGGHANLPAALASALLFGPSEAWGSAGIASGVSSALQFDLDVLMTALRAAAARDAEEVAERPRLEQLAPMASGPVAELAQLVAKEADAASVHAWVRAWREAHGGGPEARYVAFRWSAGGLEGIAHPARPDLGHLVGLTSQIDVLERNTRSFLGRRTCHERAALRAAGKW
jgi:Predicted ATPase (AAA+ superfamily)